MQFYTQTATSVTCVQHQLYTNRRYRIEILTITNCYQGNHQTNDKSSKQTQVIFGNWFTYYQICVKIHYIQWHLANCQHKTGTLLFLCVARTDANVHACTRRHCPLPTHLRTNTQRSTDSFSFIQEYFFYYCFCAKFFGANAKRCILVIIDHRFCTLLCVPVTFKLHNQVM